MQLIEVLRGTTFGKRTAEEEREQLKQYFVETEQWKKVLNDEVDVIYGAKGSGKSAIYSLVIQNAAVLADRNVRLVPAENPQGAPAFQNLSNDPPDSEFQFVSLWKLYVITLCGCAIRELALHNAKSDLLLKNLEDAELIPANFTLARVLKYALDYVKKLTGVSSLEAEVKLDPLSGMPQGFAGKIVLTEPSLAQSRMGQVSIDELFVLANEALKEASTSIWVLFDRLDVAFADKPDLEISALRSLFKFYLDCKGFNNIKPKIFLRTDIWSSLTQSGFREASHIERSLEIKWKNEDLTNLIVRRALSNKNVCDYYSVDSNEVLADFGNQESFIYKMFPAQVETGPNKPTAFAWVLSRTKDTVQQGAPRELIHFCNVLRDVQLARLERGEKPPIDRKLFEQIAFKEALPTVSKVRLEQTLFAEFPQMKPFVEALREQKATQTTASLASIWNVDLTRAVALAAQLEEIGFFERLGVLTDASWRVPFLYRPALSLVQGSSDT